MSTIDTTGAILDTVSKNLFARQSDDRYADLPSMIEAARTRQNNARELPGIPAGSLLFVPNEDRKNPVSLTIDHPSASDLPGRLSLTNYSASQLASAARVPLELLQRVEPATAARVLNESIRSERCGLSDRSILIDASNGTPHVRALTSDRYARVWDADIFGRISEWLAPVGYRPATPTFSWGGDDDGEPVRDIFGDDRPALWSGDRDSFAFFYTEPDANGADFGGLRRGIYVGNSEVGAASLQWSTFMFRDVCANFLVWGAQQQKKRRARHVGQSKRLFSVFCRELQHLAREAQPLPMEQIERAAATAFAGDGSPTEANIGVGRRAAREAIRSRQGRGASGRGGRQAPAERRARRRAGSLVLDDRQRPHVGRQGHRARIEHRRGRTDGRKGALGCLSRSRQATPDRSQQTQTDRRGLSRDDDGPLFSFPSLKSIARTADKG